MFFVPIMIMAGDTHNESLNLLYVSNKAYENTNIYYPFILNCLILILSIVVIFLFKNRVLQFRLSNFIVLLSIVHTSLFFMLSFDVAFSVVHEYSFGAFLPIISAIFAYLAAYFIKKDEQMVRNADRIR